MTFHLLILKAEVLSTEAVGKEVRIDENINDFEVEEKRISFVCLFNKPLLTIDCVLCVSLGLGDLE